MVSCTYAAVSSSGKRKKMTPGSRVSTKPEILEIHCKVRTM